MRNCTKLHNRENPGVVQSIYVSSDLTADASKKLWNELKQCKGAGEKNFIITRDKIITHPNNAEQEGYANMTSNWLHKPPKESLQVMQTSFLTGLMIWKHW